MNQFHTSPREFFQKFAEIFASQGAPMVSTTLVANLPPVSATPAGLPLVSTTPAEDLPLVSLTPAAKFFNQFR
jgi:hypothetical protein